MPGPLESLRVIDLTNGPVGGVASMVLADFGADVVKVERPGGDPFRFLASAPVWLRGKRSIVLDLTSAEGREQLARLAESADLVLTTATDARAQALGYDRETLAARSPGLVTCTITGFGPVGPYADYPGYDGIVSAKAGRMQFLSGLTRRDGQHFSALPVASHATAFAAVTGSLAALIARERTGRGQRVETSLLQGITSYDLVGLAHASLKEREPELWAEPPIPPPLMPTINYHPVMTKDGRWLQLGNLLQHLFDNFLVVAGFADIFADPAYEGSPATWSEETREAFRDRMLLHMRERTLDEWMQLFIEHGGVVAHPYQSTQQALDDPDLTGNGHVIEAPHPLDPTLPMREIGLLARLEGSPGSVRVAFPAVGEHTAQVLAERRTARPSVDVHAPQGPPLEGITVLDFSTIIAAPLAATHLADLGARVIKIEQVGGDPWRWMYQGLGFAKTNAGKESIALDLKSGEGRAIAHALIARADVVMHNYRPGVPERLGIGYEQARAIRPDVIYVSANGYGLGGPSAHRPATHPIPGAALGGAVWQSGSMPTCTSLEELREGARRLSRANEVNPDPNTSAVIASATMIALWHRQRTGQGQQLFTDMMGANAWANIGDFFAHEGREPRPRVDDEVLGTGPLYRLYRCAEGWVFLAVVLDVEWNRLCATLAHLDAHPDLHEDARFATREARASHADDLATTLAEIFATREADQWERSLTARGIGCVRADGPLPGDFWHTDPHVAANGFTSRVTHFDNGPYERYHAVARVRGAERIYGPAPVGGEHAEALLFELGYDVEAIARLRAAGVIWSEPSVLARRS